MVGNGPGIMAIKCRICMVEHFSGDLEMVISGKQYCFPCTSKAVQLYEEPLESLATVTRFFLSGRPSTGYHDSTIACPQPLPAQSADGQMDLCDEKAVSPLWHSALSQWATTEWHWPLLLLEWFAASRFVMRFFRDSFLYIPPINWRG
jgi:hypothetical protein